MLNQDGRKEDQGLSKGLGAKRKKKLVSLEGRLGGGGRWDGGQGFLNKEERSVTVRGKRHPRGLWIKKIEGKGRQIAGEAL